jgi:hypothetical protein
MIDSIGKSYDKIVPVRPDILNAYSALIWHTPKNLLQCSVVHTGEDTFVHVIDEPPGSRMFINGEWQVKDVDRYKLLVVATSENLFGSSPSVADVERYILNQVKEIWLARLKEFEELRSIVEPVADRV